MAALKQIGTSLLFILLCEVCFSQAAVDSTQPMKNTFTFNGTLQLNNMGFAPVPAFSFNNPIAMAFLSLKKRRFSYEPNYQVGLDGQPWLMENWLRYRFLDHQHLYATAGVNLFLFFQTEIYGVNKERLDVNRNMALELSCKYLFTEKQSFTFSYQHIHAFDDTPGGNFISTGYSYFNIPVSKKIFADLNSELFISISKENWMVYLVRRR